MTTDPFGLMPLTFRTFDLLMKTPFRSGYTRVVSCPTGSEPKYLLKGAKNFLGLLDDAGMEMEL
jgi:hypothetical protein